MAKKTEVKVPKYQEGDILKSTNSKSPTETIVILIRRWDIKPYQRIAWLCQTYPNREIECAIPESELFPIN